MPKQISPFVIAFGANLGNRAATITAAFNELAAHEQIFELQLSPLVRSVKLTLTGRDAEGPEYLNAVAVGATTLTASGLLTLLQQIENKHGRVRSARWSDRTLDLDIISFAGLVTRSPTLTLPHPSAHERDFVLAPWLALDPHAVLLRHGKVADLLVKIGNTTTVYQPGDADVVS